MKNVMTRAWEIAKDAVVKFGGSAVEYLSGALKTAWAEIKRGVEKMEGSEKQVAWAEVIKAKIEMFIAEYRELKAIEKRTIQEGNTLSARKTILFGGEHTMALMTIERQFKVSREELKAMTKEEKLERKAKINHAKDAYEEELIQEMLEQNQASFWINKFKWVA